MEYYDRSMKPFCLRTHGGLQIRCVAWHFDLAPEYFVSVFARHLQMVYVAFKIAEQLQ